MTPPAEDTRTRLIDAATREFAAHGVHAASLLEITRQAGQRNRGAVHYHFGSRVGMLVAVLEQQVDFLAARENEMLRAARSTSPHDVSAVLEAIVRPAVELSALGTPGRAYLIILAELTDEGPQAHPPEVVEVLSRFGGYSIYDLLAERMPPMPEPVRAERLSLVAGFVLKAVAERARNADREQHAEGHEDLPSRPRLGAEQFVANLVAMAAAMVTAPLPDDSPAER